MSEHIKAIDRSGKSLRLAASKLAALSVSFGHTGNSYMAKVLMEVAVCINDAEDEIQTAISEKIHSDFHEARDSMDRSFGLAITACLDNAEIKTDGD